MARRFGQLLLPLSLLCFAAPAICAYAAQVDKIKDPALPGGKGKWTDSGTWQGGGQAPNNSNGNSFNTQITSGTVELDAEVTVTSLLLDTTGGIVTAETTTGNQGRKLTVQGKGSAWKSGSLLGTNGTGEFVISSSGDVSTPDLSITTASQKSLSNWTLRNSGFVLWDGGALSSGNGAMVANESDALFTTTFDGLIAYDLGGTRTNFTNAGTFRKAGGSGGRTEIQANFQNTGLVQVSAGTLRLSGGGSSTGGEFAVADGGRLEFNGGYTLSGTKVGGPGRTAILNGTLLVAGPTASEITGSFELTEDSAIGGDGILAVTGTLEWLGGNMLDGGVTAVSGGGQLVLSGLANKRLAGSGGSASARRLENDGLIAVSGSGALLLFDGAAITNRGDFDLRSDAGVGYSGTGGAGTFTNSGVLQKSAGAGTSTLAGLNFVNNAHVWAKSGTLAFADQVTSNGGVFEASHGASIQFAGTANRKFGANSAFVGSGAHVISSGTSTFAGNFTAQHLTFSGGTLLGPASLTGSMVWSGGQWGGADTFTVTPGAVLTIDGSAAKQLLHGGASSGGRVLANHGNIVWTGVGGVLLGDGAQLTIAAGAVLDIRNDASLSYAGRGSAGSVVNDGLVIKSPTRGTTTIAQPFTQNTSGMLVIETGTLAFTSTFTNNDGAIYIAPGANLSVASPLNIGMGALMGGGTITAPAVLAGGFVSPGASPGTLTLSGDLTLLGTSVLLIQLGGLTPGTSYDVISVGGAAVLAGHLAVELVNGFSPTGSADTFTVLTAHGAAGLSGLFANATPGQRLFSADGLGSFQVNYGPTSAFGVNSVVLSNFQSIPEPSTWGMLGTGAVAVLILARGARRSVRHQ